MWTAFCAPLEPGTPLPTRAARLLRLLSVIARMWIGAHALAARLSPAARGHLARRWSRALLGALSVEVRIHGAPPTGDAVLLVANHVSWLDSYAVTAIDPACFVAKSEVATWPVIGTIARRFGTIFITRGSCRGAARAVGHLAEALCRGESVGAFPESTTSDGRALLPFFPAMFQAAVLTGARVQPVALRYRDAAGRRLDAAAYVGDMSIADSLRRLLREPRVIVEVIFCPAIAPDALTRRELAAVARQSIATALGLASAAAPTPLRRAA
jgi:1-acyl-sn-glycerol-3-phosphate acyltransferase